MNPNRSMRHDAIKHYFLADFGESDGKGSGKSFMKKECRKSVRRDEKKDIREQLDNG
jgi:hypothetical protein